MAKKSGQFNADLKAAVKAYYLRQPTLSYQALSDQSETIFGMKIPMEILKDWSEQDGGWDILRQSDEPDALESELVAVRNRLLTVINNERTPVSTLTQAIKTYVELSAQIGAGQATAKTSHDVAQQIFRDTIKEFVETYKPGSIPFVAQ